MRVDEKVKAIVEGMGLTFVFNDWTRANLSLDASCLPACVYLLPVSGTLANKNGNFRDWPNAMIAFLDRAELDFNGESNEPAVERMKALAKRFIAEVNRSGMFSPLPAETPYSVVYDQLDANVTGVVLNVQLKELQGSCM